MKPVFENKDVILRAGGISSLEAELERRFECQYPHGSWHSEILPCSGMSRQHPPLLGLR